MMEYFEVKNFMIKNFEGFNEEIYKDEVIIKVVSDNMELFIELKDYVLKKDWW